ncbi:cytochrome P450 [Hysterangium stoloniferum]|nr:cytochrome P450 [Hysterangium stoloniferum]
MSSVMSNSISYSILVGLLLAIGVSVTLYRLSPSHPLAKFPGPITYKVSSLRLAQVVLSGRRHTTIQDLHNRYGPFVRIGPNALSINSRTAIGPIYASAQCLDKTRGYNLSMLPGSGLFFMHCRGGHNIRRNIWARAFTNSNLEIFKTVLDKRTLQLTECILSRSQSGLINLAECIEHWSYDFMGDFVFGPSSDLELMRDGDPSKLVEGGKLATIVFDVLGEVPWLMDILWYLPLTKSVRNLHNLARRLVIARLTLGTNEGKDIHSEDRAENDLTIDEQTMDALFAIQAGSDTTANVLQYTFFFLLTHRKVYDCLTEELDKAFPDSQKQLDFDTLEALPYLNAVTNEALRLGTPLSGLPRITSPSGNVIDGVFIPGNTNVSVPAYTQQLDKRNFWPSPEAFIPERWLTGGLGEGSRLEATALMSFSFGPFGCLGRTLAMQELRIVVSRLLLAFHMNAPENFDHEDYHQSIRNIRTTLFPFPLPAIITHRRN